MYLEDVFSFVGGMIIGIVIGAIIGIALWILEIVGKYKAFSKSGQPGYTGLVPVVDEYVMGQLSGAKKDTMVLLLMKTFGSFLCLIPFVGGIAYLVIVIVFACKQRNAVAKSFGYDVGMTVLLVLLPFIAWMILGFGNAQYVGPSKQE